MLSVGGQEQIRSRAKRAQRDKRSESQWDELQSVAMRGGHVTSRLSKTTAVGWMEGC